MITLFLLLILTGLFWVAFHITGAFLKALVWLVIWLPLAIVIGTLGLALCCTIILIPIGVGLIKVSLGFLMPTI